MDKRFLPNAHPIATGRAFAKLNIIALLTVSDPELDLPHSHRPGWYSTG
jgi:hypothetical protein